MQREDFARVANQEFDVFVGEATVTMTLVSIEPLRMPENTAREAFSLIFKSASAVVLPQKIYPMRSRALLGAQKIGVFIVPVGRDASGVTYQAVFN